jgi:hypothetical protein
MWTRGGLCKNTATRWFRDLMSSRIHISRDTLYYSPECVGLLLSRADTLARHSRTMEHVLSEMPFPAAHWRPAVSKHRFSPDPWLATKPQDLFHSPCESPTVGRTDGRTDGRTTLPPPVRRPRFLREEREREREREREGGREAGGRKGGEEARSSGRWRRSKSKNCMHVGSMSS